MLKAVLFFCFLATLSSVSSASSQREREKILIKKMGVCLKKKDPKCLRELVSSQVFSPDGPGFGCKMTTKGEPYISAENFVDCVFKSKAKDEYCSTGTTLFEAMSECFAHPKALHTEHGYIEGAGGYLCYLVEEGGKIFLRKIMCGP